MTIDEFWALIEKAKHHAASPHDRPAALKALLTGFSAAQLQAFQDHYDRLAGRAANWDLWGVLYLIAGVGGEIAGVGGDDSFGNCRNGLISEGREIYERAMAQPESLLEGPGIWALESFGYVACELYETATGKEMERPYVQGDYLGVPWEPQDLRQRFPRAFAACGGLPGANLEDFEDGEEDETPDHAMPFQVFDFPEAKGIESHFLRDDRRGYYPPRKQFYVQGWLMIPVKGYEDFWRVLAWVAVSPEEYARFSAKGGMREVRGRLSNTLPPSSTLRGTPVVLTRDPWEGPGSLLFSTIDPVNPRGKLARLLDQGLTLRRIEKLLRILSPGLLEEMEPAELADEPQEPTTLRLYRQGEWLTFPWETGIYKLKSTDLLSMLCDKCEARVGHFASELCGATRLSCVVCEHIPHRVYDVGGVPLTLSRKAAADLKVPEAELPLCEECAAEGLVAEASCYVDEDDCVHLGAPGQYAVH